METNIVFVLSTVLTTNVVPSRVSEVSEYNSEGKTTNQYYVIQGARYITTNVWAEANYNGQKIRVLVSSERSGALKTIRRTNDVPEFSRFNLIDRYKKLEDNEE